MVGYVGIGASLLRLGGVVEGDALRGVTDNPLEDIVADSHLKFLLGLAGTHLGSQHLEGHAGQGDFGHLAEGRVGNQFLVDGGKLFIVIRADFVEFLVHDK